MRLIFGTRGSGTCWALARSYEFWLELKGPWLELIVGTVAGTRCSVAGNLMAYYIFMGFGWN